MATASDPEELRVSCPVCLEPYQRPQSLRCGHLLCTLCATQMFAQSHNDVIKCVICRQTSTERDLRRDFTMEGNVETFLEKKRREEENDRVSAIHQQSDMFENDQRQENQTDQKEHVTGAINSIIARYITCCDDNDGEIAQIQNTKSIVNSKTEQMKERINAFSERILNKCHALCDRLDQEAKVELTKLERNEKALKTRNQEIALQIVFLSNMVYENDSETLLKPGLVHDLDTSLRQYNERYDQIKQQDRPMTAFDVTLIKADKLEKYASGVDIKINRTYDADDSEHSISPSRASSNRNSEIEDNALNLALEMQDTNINTDDRSSNSSTPDPSHTDPPAGPFYSASPENPNHVFPPGSPHFPPPPSPREHHFPPPPPHHPPGRADHHAPPHPHLGHAPPPPPPGSPYCDRPGPQHLHRPGGPRHHRPPGPPRGHHHRGRRGRGLYF